MLPAIFAKIACCIDPYIYAFTHPRFKAELTKMFCGHGDSFHTSFTTRKQDESSVDQSTIADRKRQLRKFDSSIVEESTVDNWEWIWFHTKIKMKPTAANFKTVKFSKLDNIESEEDCLWRNLLWNSVNTRGWKFGNNSNRGDFFQSFLFTELERTTWLSFWSHYRISMKWKMK